jgi:hypothetical protein
VTVFVLGDKSLVLFLQEVTVFILRDASLVLFLQVVTVFFLRDKFLVLFLQEVIKRLVQFLVKAPSFLGDHLPRKLST